MGRESRLNPFGSDTGVSLPAVVRDAYGRELSVGDMVQVHTALPIPFQVVDIVPMMEPGQPPNMMKILVAARIPFGAQRNTPNQEFIRVMDREEVAADRRAKGIPEPPVEEKKVSATPSPAFSIVRPDEGAANTSVEEPSA